MGTNPANDNYTFVDENSLRPSSKAVNQRDADLLHFWDKVLQLPCSALSYFDAFLVMSKFQFMSYNSDVEQDKGKSAPQPMVD